MRSALGLSSTYRQQKGWLHEDGCLSCGNPPLLRSHKDRTEDGLLEQRQRAAPFVNFALHDVAHATKLEGKHPMDSLLV
jgi:hypothetical protein